MGAPTSRCSRCCTPWLWLSAVRCETLMGKAGYLLTREFVPQKLAALVIDDLTAKAENGDMLIYLALRCSSGSALK